MPPFIRAPVCSPQDSPRLGNLQAVSQSSCADWFITVEGCRAAPGRDSVR
jgi:hypothetical protein